MPPELVPAPPECLREVLVDLEIAHDRLRGRGESTSVTPGELFFDSPPTPGELERLDCLWAPDGWLLLHLAQEVPEAELAALRDALWPRAHVMALYHLERDGVRRRTLQGEQRIERKGPETQGVVLAARRASHVLSPENTLQKFDSNAAGWNGTPGKPGYMHHRWMRRLVGLFATAEPGARILDFGCGAGWCGVEAAKRAPGARLDFFDPSPAMVEHASENARQNGISDHEGRVGFGEDPPFPAHDEPPYQLVISSGVISFARDQDAWIEGLLNAVAPGGTLVIGDLNPDSRGMRRRRETKPLLPIREMNARRDEDVRLALEAAGLLHEESAGYQLTRPIPQALHLNEMKLHGMLSVPLWAANALTTRLDRSMGHQLSRQFDSWVMRFRRPTP